MSLADLSIRSAELNSLPKFDGRLLRIPKHATKEQFLFPGWEHSDFFGNSHPVQLEYCSGNGSWIAAKAVENPNLNWVAVEMKLGRSRKIWSKIKRLELPNLMVINGEGNQATALLFPDRSIETIYINFPDPWPKRRHAHHRIIQSSFIDGLARILKDGGKVIFVTDDAAYSEWTINLFASHPLFATYYPSPYFADDWSHYGRSFFDDLWREKGRQIRYHRFDKSVT